MQQRAGRATRSRHPIRSFATEHPSAITAVIAAALTVWVYWPLLARLRTTTSGDRDMALFIWSMEHAPWRLVHGHNPWFSTAIFATTGGANLAFNATAPGLALLMAPITAALGPVASVNVLSALTPLLNTLAARRLLRVTTGRRGWSVTFAALLVGFSPVVLMHNAGRFQLAFQAIVLLLLAELWIAASAWLDGRPLPMRNLVCAGVLAGAQVWIGTELLAITVIVGVLALIAALVLRAAAHTLHIVRPRRGDVVAIASGIASSVIVASPFLAEFLFGSERYTDPYHAPARPLFGLRLANALTPTDVDLFHTHMPFTTARASLGVFPDENTGFISVLGVAVIVLVAVSWTRRSAVERGALLVGLSCWLLALGPTILWSGTGSGPPGPWRVIERLPVLDEIVASRLSFGLFVALGVLIASIGASMSDGSVLERVLWSACVLLPVLLFPSQFDKLHTVSSDADELVEKRCGSALVLTAPQELEQEGMAWQARASFDFDLYRGFAFRASTPPKGDLLLIDDIAHNGTASTADPVDAVEELHSLGIGCVVTPAERSDVITNVSAALGPPTIAGDVAVWSDR